MTSPQSRASTRQRTSWTPATTCLIICPATYAVRASWTTLSKRHQRHRKYPGHSEAPRQQGHTARASVGIVGEMFLPVLVVAASAPELVEGISLASSRAVNMPSDTMVACWTEPPAQRRQQGSAHSRAEPAMPARSAAMVARWREPPAQRHQQRPHSPAEPAMPARIAGVMEPATWQSRADRASSHAPSSNNTTITTIHY